MEDDNRGIKTDCFAYKQNESNIKFCSVPGKCLVLTELFCAKEKCKFYIPKEEYQKRNNLLDKNSKLK